MKCENCLSFLLNRISILLSVLLVCLILAGFNSCARSSKLIISYYTYDVDDQTYRIRSVNSENIDESYNELISEKFLAVDFDQDQIIDRIVMGETSLTEAQKIYEEGLQLLSRENKLEPYNSQVKKYVQAKPCCYYEIKSFRPQAGQPSNQLKMIENRSSTNPHTIIAIDQNADGTLDEILKGYTTVEKIQPHYDSLIKKGLEENQLVRIDGMIVIKENGSNQ